MGNQDRVAEALQHSDLARALFLEAGDALFIVDPLSERVLDANPTAQKMSKRARDDLLRLTVRDIVKHELGWDDWLQTVRQTSTFHGRDGYLLKSGSSETWTPVSLTISRLHLPGTQPLALLTFRDRSEQAEAYRRVQRTEAELRRVLVSVSDCLYSYRFDPRGQRRYRYLSPVVEKLTGRPVSYFLDDPLHWGDVIEPDDRHRWREFLAGLVPRTSGEIEYRIRQADGSQRWVRESVTTAVPEEGTGILIHGIFSDVTERKQAEQIAEERRHQEEQKLESLGVLAGSLAHDFNSLLTSILGNIGLARIQLPPGSEALLPLDQGEISGLRAADICRQLLTFTGKGRVIMGPISLNDVIGEAVVALHPALPPGVAVELDLTPPLPLAFADMVQVRQLVINLVANAAEAIQDRGGTIRVVGRPALLDRTLAQQARFAAPDLIEGEAVAVEVRDTGPGISPEIQARMFEPFFSTKFQGRGLGLAVVLGIARSHKGAIFVDTEIGRGTAIRVLLPCSLGQPISPPQPSVTVLAPTTTRMVLIADDEDSVRTVTGRMLEASGFRVVQAVDGREAMVKFKQHGDAIRLVLLDLTMPHINGEDAFRQLRELRPDLPVILMSGYPEPDVMSRFVGAGLSAFLQKPFRPLDLLELVKRHFPVG